MSENLESIKANLKRVAAITEAQAKLEAELKELPPKIKELTAAVAGGEAKSVTALMIAESRLKVLPGELAGKQAEFDALVAELRAAMAGLVPELTRAHRVEFQRVESAVQAFLKAHLDEAHLIEEYTRQITSRAKTVKALEFLCNMFTRVSLGWMKTPGHVISRAKAAVLACENLI